MKRSGGRVKTERGGETGWRGKPGADGTRLVTAGDGGGCGRCRQKRGCGGERG